MLTEEQLKQIEDKFVKDTLVLTILARQLAAAGQILERFRPVAEKAAPSIRANLEEFRAAVAEHWPENQKEQALKVAAQNGAVLDAILGVSVDGGTLSDLSAVTTLVNQQAKDALQHLTQTDTGLN